MEYGATANVPTIVSLTNHSYWNLNGHDGDSIMDQELTLNCSTYTPTDPNNQSVPTGELAAVEGTEFEFRSGKGGGVPGVTIGAKLVLFCPCLLHFKRLTLPRLETNVENSKRRAPF